MIRFQCPRCKRRLELDDQLAGMLGKCPECGKEIQIPGGDSAAPVISYTIDDGPLPDLASIRIDPDKKSPPPVDIEGPARRPERARRGARDPLAPLFLAGGILLGAIVGAAITYGVMSAGGHGSQVEVDALSGKESEAYISGQKFVTQALPPGNVTEFSRQYESSYTGEGVYVVGARATTRTTAAETQFLRFRCRMILDANGQWDVADLAVEEDI